MKNGTLYAKKLKKALPRIRSAAGRASQECTDPIELLIIAVLSQEASVARAEKALRVLRENLVDYNELRVSSPAEITASIHEHIPRPVQRAKAMIGLLNAIYRTQYGVSLDGLSGRGVREIRGFLERLNGITPYVVAFMMLYGLGGHAIPVNDPTLDMLRREGLVNPESDVAEVQAFLERHVSAAEARDVARGLEAWAASSRTRPSVAPSDGAARSRSRARKPSTPTRRKSGAKSTKTGRKRPSAAARTTRRKKAARG